MFERQAPPFSRSSEPMVPKSLLQRLEASHALEAFLLTIQRLQVEKREAYFGAGKKYDLPMPALIAKPQVFFSYAWGKENEPRFVQLQTFLKEMSHYLKKAGVQVWFDLDRMVGDVESQMRDGVTRSHLVLLFGTETYSKKTGVESQTNVKKELDFTLEKAAKDKHCLMPLLLEGTFKATFPSLGYKYLMVDATPWINLENGQHDMQAYIKALTSLSDPVGILPTILGLQRMDDDYEAYRDSCRQDYFVHVSALRTQLEKIYAAVPLQQEVPHAQHADEKQSPDRESQNPTPLECWMESLADSIQSYEGNQKTLQKEEATFFEKNAFLAYEKAQTDKSLLAPRAACENTHQIVLQKLHKGKQAFVSRSESLFTVEVETQLREALLEREARVNQLENQRIVLESTRAELTTELDAHKSKAGSLEQDITRQQAQQINLVRDSVVLAERQNAKLEQLLQLLPASDEIKEELSDCHELLCDIKLKTQTLKRMGESALLDFERCNELMIDLGKHYQRCYVAIIRLMRQAGVAHSAGDAKIEQERAGQEMQAWKARYDASHVELADAKQAYEETKALLAKKEEHLSSLAAREQTLSTELEKKQAVLEEVLQKQEEVEKEKATLSELALAHDVQKKVLALEEEKNKLIQQLQAVEKQSAEQSLKIGQLKNTEEEKVAAVKKAVEESEKTITSEKAKTELEAATVQAYEETKALLAKKEAHLSSLAEREQTLSAELEKKQASLEEAIQKQEKLEQEKANVLESTRVQEAQKKALEEEKNKLSQQLRAVEKQSAEQSLKIGQLKNAEEGKAKQIEAEKAAAVKKAVEKSEKAVATEKAKVEAEAKMKAQADAQVALQAEEMQKLKEELAAEKKKLAEEKEKAAKAKEVAEKLAAEKAQVEADQKYAEKMQTEQAQKIAEKEKVQQQAEQVQKEQEKAEQQKKAAAEENKEADTEGRIKVYSHFWKPAKATPPDVSTFLRLVAEGEQDKAEALLKANPRLGLAAGSVTDLSKRTFKNITALQYALWALDWNMWLMLLKYIPRDEAQLQAMALDENGTEHGKYFDFSQLLGAYQTYEQNYKAWYKASNWDAMETHWCKQVGGAQLLLPAHVVNEYCRPDRAFYPLPDFKQEGLPRVRELEGKAGSDVYCFVVRGGRIGEKWGLVRAGAPRNSFSWPYVMYKIVSRDQVVSFQHADACALGALCEARVQQQQLLIQELLRNKPLLGNKG